MALHIRGIWNHVRFGITTTQVTQPSFWWNAETSQFWPHHPYVASSSSEGGREEKQGAFFRCRLLLLTFQSPLLFLLMWSSANIHYTQELGPWFHKAASKEDKWWKMLEKTFWQSWLLSHVSIEENKPRPFNYKNPFCKKLQHHPTNAKFQKVSIL